MKLGSCNMILGIDWLAKHSPIEFNLKELNMKICKGRQEVVLLGKSTNTELKMQKGSRIEKWL